MRRLIAAVLAGTVASGAAQAADARWDTYQLLMWQDRTPAQMAGLRALGFTGAKLSATGGRVDTAGRALRQKLGLEVYLENIATDFYAAYHRFQPNVPVNAAFVAAQALHAARPDDPAAFTRAPGLSDPAWLARVAERLSGVVGAEPLRPLFYNLADESGIADLAAAWDFDLAPDSLAGMRSWLRDQYGSLGALNRQWGTAFTTWDAVQPELTDAALRRTDANYSAWSDFKAWMDVAFARAVAHGTDAVHAADPAAAAALEGAQIPGWGGYDYSRLAPAVDVMEIYDYGESLDLAMAFHPGLIALRTSFGAGLPEAHAAWHALLHGVRGTVVWDEADDVVAADGTAGPRGREIAALVAALREVAPHVRQPSPDAVAVLYSQESFRVGWLLDRLAGDRNWARRDAEREYDDTTGRESRRVLLRRLGALGVQPRLVAAVDGGGLRGIKVLFLPHAIALSDAEVAAVHAFVAGGGTVLADTEAGLFDGHGRRRDTPPLPEVLQPAAIRADGRPDDPATLTSLAELLTAAGAPPRLMLLGPDGQRATGIEVRWFEDGGGRLAAVQRAEAWAGPPFLQLRGAARLLDGRAVPEQLMLDAVSPTLLRPSGN